MIVDDAGKDAYSKDFSTNIKILATSPNKHGDGHLSSLKWNPGDVNNRFLVSCRHRTYMRDGRDDRPFLFISKIFCIFIVYRQFKHEDIWT